MTKTRITQRTTNNPTNLPASGVVRFDGNIQAASRGSFAPQLQPIRFTPGGEYLEQINAIADLGEGIFNATSRVAMASFKAKEAEKDAYLADIKADDIVQTNRIYNENRLEGNDPQVLATKLEEYRNGKMANMPQDIQPFYQRDFDIRAASLGTRSQDEFYRQAQENARVAKKANLEIIKDDIFKNPMPITEIDQELYRSKLTSYKALQQSRIDSGDITPEEALLEEKDFRKDIITQAYKAHLDSQPNSDARAQEVLKLHKTKTLLEGLDESDRDDIVARLNAYDSTINAIEIKASAAKRAEQEAIKAKSGADLEVNVVDGVATREDIFKAEHNGIISPVKRVQLLKLLKSQEEDQVRDMNLMTTTLNAAYNGQGFLDPKNSDHKKGIDITYEKVIKPELDKAPTGAAKKQLVVNYIQHTGIVPESLRGEMRATFRGDNVDKKVFYADLIGRLQEVKPQALDDFDDKDIVQGIMISDLVKAGTPNEFAVQKVEEATSGLTPARIQLLEDSYNEFWKDIGSPSEQRKSIVNDFADYYDKSWFYELNASLPRRGSIPFFKETVTQMGIEVALEEDYKKAFKTYYLSSNGDAGIAKQQAIRSLGSSWGVTSINGTRKQLTKYPIEKEYSMMDASNKYNFGPSTRWLRKELVKDFTSIPKYKNIDPDDIFIESDDQTAREKSGGQYPSYKIGFFNKKGEIEYPAEEDHKRWYPDVDKYIKTELEAVKRRHEAQLLKEELSVYSVDPLNSASSLLGTLPQKQ